MPIFGPVPSRRLGQSLGVNNIPPKVCSYSCCYCQIGSKGSIRIRPDNFYDPADIFNEAEEKIRDLDGANRIVDYITIVPDGEPTLDINLGKTICLLKKFGIKTAVITNASLLWIDEVRENLREADLVSVKVDASNRETWRKVDRPHGRLDFDTVIQGLKDFARMYEGDLISETMLVKGLNDSKASVGGISELLAAIRPRKAYLLVPTRPPAVTGVERADPDAVGRAFDIVTEHGIKAECITGNDDEDGFYLSADDLTAGILRIASVHPIREDILIKILHDKGFGMDMINDLTNSGALEELMYENVKYYRKKNT